VVKLFKGKKKHQVVSLVVKFCIFMSWILFILR